MIRNIRLYSGWILFTYISTHLINHMVGLWSLEAMDNARALVQYPWHTTVGQIFLSATIITHGSLAFYALYDRRNFAVMKKSEWVQLVFGFSIPPLLIVHYLGTLVVNMAYETNPNYAWLLLIYWKADIPTGIRQISVLLLAWTHGCMGIYFWLRLKEIWPKIRTTMFSLAILWPLLALLGIWAGTKEVLVLFHDPVWLKQLLRETHQPDNAALLYLKDLEINLILGYCGLIILVLAARQLRPYWERRHGTVNITYDTGKSVLSIPGLSFLDISRQFQQPHASVCGGRGRCSTCRIRINDGADKLPPPSPEEQKILTRINAGSDIRLACQCFPPKGNYSISCVVPADQEAKNLHHQSDLSHGQEREITVLFADLRGFTQLSEEKLPYDVVFILNRFFAMMGTAVEKNGGHLDKFIGDGVMALFGLNVDSQTCARQALKCSNDMVEGIKNLNKTLSGDLKYNLQIGIGIHTGFAIIGDMGYGTATQLTAIGDTVNTASRLEGLSKELDSDVVVSENTIKAAALKDISLSQQETAIRGREQRLSVHLLKRPQDYRQLLESLNQTS